MSTPVSAITLRQGAWHALEQAGRLLNSAATLAEAGDWITAAGIAMLGLEEFGRSKLLRSLAAQVGAGQSFTATHVREACDDHPGKQRAAVTNTTMRATNDTGLGKLLRTRTTVEPGSPEWRSTEQEIERVTDAKTKRLPDDRHRLRMLAFYTDIEANGYGWSRPWDISRQAAMDAVIDAINTYSLEVDRLRDEVIEENDPEMAAVRVEMDPKPVLMSPRWPRASAASLDSTDHHDSAKPVRGLPSGTIIGGVVLASFVAGWATRGWL